MKKILSLTVFAATFLALSFTAESQVHYSYTYYDHTYDLPSYVTTVVHKQYAGCHLVRGRSYYMDDQVAFNLVFQRGDSFVEIVVNHHGYITKRVHYTYNPVTHIWVRPHHQHYYVNNHHHDHHYVKHHHGQHTNNKYYKERGSKHYKHNSGSQYERRDESRNSRSGSAKKSGSRKSTERYHSYAKR